MSKNHRPLHWELWASLGRQIGKPTSYPTTSGSTLALIDGLCFLFPCDTSRSPFTSALILEAGLSLSYLSKIPGPPHIVTTAIDRFCEYAKKYGATEQLHHLGCQGSQIDLEGGEPWHSSSLELRTSSWIDWQHSWRQAR